MKSPAPGERTRSAPAQSQLSALAASAGISVNQLEAGLAAMKEARGDTAAGIVAFASATGVSRATAQRIVTVLTNT